MSATDPGGTRGPNCWQCQFFAISWHPRLPYACQRMGFKSQVLPAIEVLRTDGQPCHGFVQRAPAPGQAEPPKPTSNPPMRLSSTQSWQA